MKPSASGIRSATTSTVEREKRAPNARKMVWVTAAWGACFVAIQWGLRDAPVLWFAALRALVAGSALLMVAAVQRRPALRGVRAWVLVTVLGAGLPPPPVPPPPPPPPDGEDGEEEHIAAARAKLTAAAV